MKSWQEEQGDGDNLMLFSSEAFLGLNQFVRFQTICVQSFSSVNLGKTLIKNHIFFADMSVTVKDSESI